MADIRSLWIRTGDNSLLQEDDRARRRKLAAEYLRDETRDMPMDLRKAIADFLDELGKKDKPGGPPKPPRKWYEIGQFLEDQEDRGLEPNDSEAARHFGVSRDTVRRAKKYYEVCKRAHEEAVMAERENSDE